MEHASLTPAKGISTTVSVHDLRFLDWFHLELQKTLLCRHKNGFGPLGDDYDSWATTVLLNELEGLTLKVE